MLMQATLGEPPLGAELVYPQAFGHHRHLAGAIGTAVGQQHLKSILSFCNSPMMNAIEAYIQVTPNLISDDGKVSVGATETFLRNYMTEFSNFIGRVLTAYPRTA